MNSMEGAHPIACRLKALDTTERRRQKELLESVRGKTRGVVELDDGFEIELPSDSASFMEVAEWVNLERRCCAFAEFATLSGRDDLVRGASDRRPRGQGGLLRRDGDQPS